MNNSKSYTQISIAVKTSNMQEIKQFIMDGGNIIPFINDLVYQSILSKNNLFLNYLAEKGYLKEVNIDRAFFYSAKYSNIEAFDFFSKHQTPDISLISVFKNSDPALKTKFSMLTGHTF